MDSTARSSRGVAVLVATVALALACAFAGIAAAEPVRDPHEPSAAEKRHGEEEGSEAAEIRDRGGWFLNQRAYPFEKPPAGALLRAKSEARAAPTENLGAQAATDGAPATAFGPIAASAAISSWTPLGPNGLPGGPESVSKYTGRAPWAGRVTTIANDPTNAAVAYIGAADGGVWKTTNGGASWTPLTNSLGSLAVGAIAIDPQSPSTLYVGTGEANNALDNYFGSGLYKSTDGGASWSKLGGATFDRCYVADILVKPGDSNTVIAAVASYGGKYATNCPTGIHRSTNGGTSWQQVTSAQCRPTDLAVSPAAPSTIYAGLVDCSGRGIYRSTASGASGTFDLLQGLTSPQMGRIALAVSPSDGRWVWAAVGNASDNQILGIFGSNDFGDTWGSASVDPDFCGGGASGQCFYDITIAVDPQDPTTVYAGGLWMYRITAPNFQTVQIGAGTGGIHSDQHALSFDAAGRLWVGNDGGAYRSSDGGASFANLNAGLPITQINPGVSGTLSFLTAGTQDNGLMHYQANAWRAYSAFGDGGATAFDPANPNVIYAGYVKSRVRWTLNGGADGFFNDFDPKDPAEFYPPIVMDPAVGGRVLLGTNRIWRRSGPAGSWTALTGQSVGTTTAIGLSPASSQVAYYATENPTRLVVTTNGFGSLTDTLGNGLPDRFLADIAVDSQSPGTAYVAAGGFGTGHVFKTTNFGGTWTNISGDLPDTPVNALAVDESTTPDTIYAGTDVGVYSSDDGGASWVRAGGLPIIIISDVRIDKQSDQLIAATHGQGAFATPIPRGGGGGGTAHDAFSDPRALTGTSATATGDSNAGATKETGEPNHANNVGGASIWYDWTAPVTGTVAVDTRTSAFDTVLGVYTGSTVGSLTSIASNDDEDNPNGIITSRVTFHATAGVRYRIAVDGFNGGTGAATGSVALHLSEQGDQFALSVSKSGTGSGTVTSAPAGISCGGTCSVSFAAGTPVTLTATPAAGSTFGGWGGACAGAPGTTCSVTMDAARSVTASFATRVAPPNDAFANATALTGATASRSADTNVGASKEAGEPHHADNPGGASVWYRWTAGSSGPVTLDTAGSDFDTTLGVYTGSTVGGLATVASNDDENNQGGIITSKLTFQAVAGTTYRIAVDGFNVQGGGPATGSVNLHLAQAPSRALSVTKDGAGSGTVTSSPAGIACGATCSASFSDRSSVTLTATPAAGSVFGAWSGACAGVTTAVCTVTLDAAKTVNATFGLAPPAPANDDFANPAQLTGSGAARTSDTNVGATKQAGEPNHASNAGGGSVWYRWTAPVSGLVGVDTLGSDFDTTLGVYSGTTIAGLTELGSNDDAQGLGTFTTNSLVFAPVTAGNTYRIAVDGYNFQGGGAARGNVQIHVYEWLTLGVSRTGSGTGSVTSSPSGIDCGTVCQRYFLLGDTVDLTAAPDAGSAFGHWSGDCAGSLPTCTVTMSSARSVTATFDDVAPPETSIASGPPQLGRGRDVSFGFASTEPGSTFECELDHGGFNPCTSPASYTGLADGTHHFEVQATDPSHNVDASPATSDFTIDATAPDTFITSAPGAVVHSASATFAFASPEGGSRFECRLLGGFVPCGAPITYAGLLNGAASFQVRALDPAGNTDPVPARRDFRVSSSTSPRYALLTVARSRGLARLYGGGFGVGYSCRRACRLNGVLSVSGATARHYGLGSRPVTIAAGASARTSAGEGRLHLVLTRAARTRLAGASSVPATLSIAVAKRAGTGAVQRFATGLALTR